MKTKKFKIIIKIIIKKQKVIKENTEHKASSKIIIIDNISV